MFFATSADYNYKRAMIGVLFLETNYTFSKLINVMVSKLITTKIGVVLLTIRCHLMNEF